VISIKGFLGSSCNSPLAWTGRNRHEGVKILMGREDVKGDRSDMAAEHRF